MEQFLRQLQTIPEAAELIRRVEEGGCPAAVSGLQPVQRACVGAAVAAGLRPPGGVSLRGRAGGPGPLAGDLETLTGTPPRDPAWPGVAVPPRGRGFPGLGAEPSGGAVRPGPGATRRWWWPPRTPSWPGPCRRRPCGPWPSRWRWGGRRIWARWPQQLLSAGLYPLRAGGGRGPVRPAGRHSGRVLSPDGPAGAVRVF